MGAEGEEKPPFLSSWRAVYFWVLISLVVSIALLRLLGRFGT